MTKVWIAAVVVMGACGTQRVNVCTSDTECKDPAYPFCDVNGEYPASGGVKNVCTVMPDNCPVDRCGCTAGAVLSCVGDQVTTCASDGMSTATETCALGCAIDGTRCLTFEPSNGVGLALAEASSQPDLVVPGGAMIDTDLGILTAANGITIAVKTELIAQTGGPAIRALVAHSFVVNNVKVTGSYALALVADGPITIQGLVDAAAHGSSNGPGGEAAPYTCAGGTAQQYDCTVSTITRTVTPGAGGGGDDTAGGNTNGGEAVTGFVPLYGGGRGGDVEDKSATTIGLGGGGGGALEFVSGTKIAIVDSGFLDLGGGGGNSSSGGGAGGTVILEAPEVAISGGLAGVTANGGGGGACGGNGGDASRTLTPAFSPTCTGTSSGGYSGGPGGTATSGPGSSGVCTGTCQSCDPGPYGGGGGAVGRMRVATKDGAYAATGTPTISIVISAATLAPQ